MNASTLLSRIETIESYSKLAYGKCRFIIDGTFDDDEKSNLLEILEEIKLLTSNAIENLKTNNKDERERSHN